MVKIAIINDVHIGKPLEHNQKVRAASHLTDIIINLGDPKVDLFNVKNWLMRR